MYDTNVFYHVDLNPLEGHQHPAVKGSSENALKLFGQAHLKGRLSRFLCRFLHKGCLAELDSARSGKKMVGSSSAGIRAVAISQILGSEGRSSDFDSAFTPLQERTRDRWTSIARARLNGTALPPVSLVQVDGVYYVRDGHHRLSVARALGQEVIDAEVTVLRLIDSSAPAC
jgi:uncharacterized ParB-like nuclease family protein